jgi:hypothetical protein
MVILGIWTAKKRVMSAIEAMTQYGWSIHKWTIFFIGALYIANDTLYQFPTRIERPLLESK